MLVAIATGFLMNVAGKPEGGRGAIIMERRNVMAVCCLGQVRRISVLWKSLVPFPEAIQDAISCFVGVYMVPYMVPFAALLFHLFESFLGVFLWI